MRAGQIVGTGSLMSIRCREAIAMMGPPPFEGALERPGPGVGRRQGGPALGRRRRALARARWLVLCDDGRRLPATLSMLLFDSSGVDKDAALTEHRDALAAVTTAVTGPDAEPMAASGAVDWLLFDWVMAHRESADSGAVEIRSGQTSDARMIVLAAGASARVRSRFDVGLLEVPR